MQSCEWISASLLPPWSNTINNRQQFEIRGTGVHHAHIDWYGLFPDRMWTMDWMKRSQGNLFMTVCWTQGVSVIYGMRWGSTGYLQTKKEMLLVSVLVRKRWIKGWLCRLTDIWELLVGYLICAHFHTQMVTSTSHCRLLCSLLAVVVFPKAALFNVRQKPWIWIRPPGPPLGRLKDRWE